jgi:phosphoadenosine phosphosulfate reductase
MKEKVAKYNTRLAEAQPWEVIAFVAKEFQGKVCFASSLGLEDQVITHMIAQSGIKMKIFTLDTGRMFQETYSLLDRTRERYNIKISIYFPDKVKIEGMVNEFGANLFYESVAKRQLCCRLRKMEPSKRALSGMSAWICGLRRSQSITREELNVVEWDAENGLFKVNPLINWSLEQVWEYIRKNDIPYNPLHDKGFPSIGCLPCTRAVKSGEDLRGGRWWWEDPDKKECGLHTNGESE